MFERIQNGVVDVIRGDLPLNGERVVEVRGMLQNCLRNGQPYVIMDLENVPLVDSAGLELLLDFREEYAQIGGALKLAGPNALCREILTVTGLDESFEVFDEALSAIGSFVR